MKLHQIPERYATVWGVGHDLEVVEHVIWTPKDALTFARYNALDKFREVTDVVYTNPQAPLAPMYRPKDWQQRRTAAQEWFLKERQAVVDEATGFTNVAGYRKLREWQAIQRPDLEPPGSMDWAKEQMAVRSKWEEAGVWV